MYYGGCASIALVTTLAHAAPPPAAGPAIPGLPAMPKLPAIPSLPKVTGLPGLPGLPGAAPAGKAPPAAAPAATAAPAPPAATMSPTTDGAGTAVSTESSNGDEGATRTDLGKPDENGLPNTLPTGVRRSVHGGEDEDETGATTVGAEDVSTSMLSGAVNRQESVKTAPAWTLVFSAATLRARGYANLSELLDDLPGVDVSRSFGPSYANASFRGVRTGSATAPYIVAVDGLPLNNLFSGDAHTLAAIPITNVERVEVSYGPSPIYWGPNAVGAVINITTRTYGKRQLLGDYGTHVDARMSYGGSSANMPFRALATKIIDATAAYIGHDFVFRAAARMEAAVLDRGTSEGYSYLGDTYYSDPRLWGRRLFDAYPTIGGRFESPDNKRSIDARLEFKDLEVGVQYYARETGQGLSSPGDRVQTTPSIFQDEKAGYLRHTLHLSRDAKAESIIRYRASSLGPNSSVLLRRDGQASPSYDFSRNPNEGPVFYQMGQESSATSLQTDLTTVLARGLFLRKDELSFSAGLRYSMLRIATDYATSNAVGFPIRHPSPSSTDCITSPLAVPARDEAATVPPQPSAIPAGQNLEYIGCALGGEPGAGSLGQDARSVMHPDQFGSYVSARYEFSGRHFVHAGVRLDGITLPGASISPNGRFAYVGEFPPYIIKFLYSRASFDPSSLERMNSRFGNTANTVVAGRTLLAEKSHTMEVHLDTNGEALSVHAGGYFQQVSDPRSTFDDAKLTSRQVLSSDLSVRFAAGPVRGYAVYSHIFMARESGTDAAGAGMERSLGDIALRKTLIGATYSDGPFSASVHGRCIGARTTIPTNPVAELPAYCTLDANIVLRNLPFQGLSYGLRTTNILDTQYAQPGIGRADAGIGPGLFLPNGGYAGSLGMDSSMLPQPRRTILFTLGFEQ